jgi:hypothetical protein
MGKKSLTTIYSVRGLDHFSKTIQDVVLSSNIKCYKTKELSNLFDN